MKYSSKHVLTKVSTLHLQDSAKFWLMCAVWMELWSKSLVRGWKIFFNVFERHLLRSARLHIHQNRMIILQNGQMVLLKSITSKRRRLNQLCVCVCVCCHQYDCMNKAFSNSFNPNLILIISKYWPIYLLCQYNGLSIIWGKCKNTFLSWSFTLDFSITGSKCFIIADRQRKYITLCLNSFLEEMFCILAPVTINHILEHRFVS